MSGHSVLGLQRKGIVGVRAGRTDEIAVIGALYADD